MSMKRGLVVLIAVTTFGCREAPRPPVPGATAPAVPVPVPAATTPVVAPAEPRVRVAFLGDSLTAGLGLAAADAFPARLGALLAAEGHPIDVTNAGVSGDTSEDGLARVDWLLSQHPQVVVVALGANDGLRGLPTDRLERNLDVIVQRCQESGATVLLCGMRLPPNYGRDYVRDFEAVFPRIGERRHVPVMPFLLEGVAMDPKLNQDDGIHPTAEGHGRVAAAVLPYLRPLVTAAEGVTK
jgi:acyl-CoA thioesterase-1